MHHLTLDRKIDYIEQVVDEVLNRNYVDEIVDDFLKWHPSVAFLRHDLKRLVESGVRLGKKSL